MSANQDLHCRLQRFTRLPGLRALAWSGDRLYASRRYQLMQATIPNASYPDVSRSLNWRPVASFHPNWKRRFSATNFLSARAFRDGFHALAVLPSGGLVAAVPGAIVTVRANQTEFRQTFAISRGTRPLHITTVPSGTIYWGEYFDNSSREEVLIYASSDGGATWNVAYTFPKAAIRHVHNIVHDPWDDCLWIMTGDYGDECRIMRAACDFSRVEIVLQGNQQARAVAVIPTKDALYFSSDTPLESNYIYRLDRQGSLSLLAPISGSSIYGCRVGDRVFFSTMVEPSEVNRDQAVRLYGADVTNDKDWQPLLAWQKDRWPAGLFQYGNAFLPDGNNTTNVLALSTIAVKSDDMVLALYALEQK